MAGFFVRTGDCDWSFLRLFQIILAKILPMTRRKQVHKYFDQCGFTLAELLVGCALFGIVAAIAVPRFIASQPGLRLNGATRDVYAQLMRARGLAVEENNNHVVSIPNNHTLSILDDNDNSGTTTAGDSTTTVDIQLNYPDITISKGGGQPDPTFLPRGTTQGNTTITVTNSAGSRTISVNITGVVKIN
jgi:prepilin-type N-terminal cleavage/methylation domain-containing protein